MESPRKTISLRFEEGGREGDDWGAGERENTAYRGPRGLVTDLTVKLPSRGRYVVRLHDLTGDLSFDPGYTELGMQQTGSE